MRTRLIYVSNLIRAAKICQSYSIEYSRVRKGDYLFKLDNLNLSEKKIIKEISGKFSLLSILKDNNDHIIIKIIPDKMTLLEMSNVNTESPSFNAFMIKVVNFFTFEKKCWELGHRTLDFHTSPIIMGILNITSDSFSDGGHFLEKEKAIDRAMQMIEQGARIIDIGGESTRPGADQVSETDELQRVIPVIEELKKLSETIISVDTYKSSVAEEALKAGADIINDVSGTVFDEKMKQVISDYKCPVVIMHMKGTPKTMQQNPEYNDLVEEVYHFLDKKCAELGKLNDDKIIIDPGYGFGKTVNHNLELLRDLSDFTFMGMPLLVGVSRKSFIGKVLDVDVDQRITGSLIAEMYAFLNGADILRVHDIKETMQAKKILNQILAA